MTRSRRARALTLLVAALVLAMLGQYYFLRRPDYLWDGLVFEALAALFFLLAWRTTRTRTPRAARSSSRTIGALACLYEHPVVTALLGLGLLLSTAATLLSRGRAWNQATYDAVTLWLLGMAAVLAAALWPTLHVRSASQVPCTCLRLVPCGWRVRETVRTSPGRILRKWQTSLRAVRRETWLELTTVAGLTVLALVLRATALDSLPYTLAGDEAWFGLTARQVLHGQLRNPFVTAYISMPTLFYWPVSWSLWLFGDNMLGLRLPAAVIGAATVPLLYVLARSLWGRRTALLAALFLAAYDYHIHYSRIGMNNVWDAFFAVLTVWLVERGLASEKSKRRAWFLIGGLALGLSSYFYTGARLLPLLVVAYLAFAWLVKRLKRAPGEPLSRLGSDAALLGVAFLVVFGPLLGFALAHPNDWNARINEVGIVQSGWLAREPGLTGKSTLQILAEQFLRAAGAFHVFPDRTVWYGGDRPLLGFAAGILALLGMAWALAHWRERRHFLVLIWFWAVIVAGGMLTESPPSSQRLVMAIPAVALLVALGLEHTLRLVQRILNAERLWTDVALGLLILALAAGSIQYYFVQYTPSRRYGSDNGETATMIGHYLRGLDPGTRAYFFGAPRIYWAFGTMEFLAPDVPGKDVLEPLQAPPGFVDSAQGAVWVFLPERAGELAWAQQAFPDGHLRQYYDAGGRLRFMAYELSPPQRVLHRDRTADCGSAAE